ncbi:hypothetical protein [Rhizobium leguminosarum]|uniref:hypothetical protein n=1 Tax=Rhizobium leguminosarum TaxID=384 RepID=UPI001555F441|nr:hypothetical protein [Rhizobium leguminosarum]
MVAQALPGPLPTIVESRNVRFNSSFIDFPLVVSIVSTVIEGMKRWCCIQGSLSNALP